MDGVAQGLQQGEEMIRYGFEGPVERDNGDGSKDVWSSYYLSDKPVVIKQWGAPMSYMLEALSKNIKCGQWHRMEIKSFGRNKFRISLDGTELITNHVPWWRRIMRFIKHVYHRLSY